MFDAQHHDGPKPRCFFTEVALPSYINHDQPSTKKKPFSTILNQQFTHTLDIILPSDHTSAFSTTLSQPPAHYALVYMKLSELISGDFFNQYIKSGNILMRSQGRSYVDSPLCTLSDGLLRIQVNKPTYERLGLQGNPIPGHGRKHVKSGYEVEINLRLPSMVHGKKGFQRVVWAFDNVLNQTMTWLLYDLTGNMTDHAAPVAKHQPMLRALSPEMEKLDKVLIPTFPLGLQKDDCDDAMELLEWLTLVSAGSPRVQQGGGVDPVLCRYQVPQSTNEALLGEDLLRMRWHGFLPAKFITKVFLAGMKAASENGWFALMATSFSGEAYAILKTGHQTMIWEYMD